LILAAKGLTATYEGASKSPALVNVNTEVSSRHCYALLGPNGCGKSTLLLALSGLLGASRQSGDVTIDATPLSQFSGTELARRVCYVPPACTASSVFTALEIAAQGGYPARLTPQESINKAVATLQRLGLSAIAHTPFFALSHGQRQSALLARALVQNPDFLLLDESLAGVDYQNLGQLMQALEEWRHQRPGGIIMTTHDYNLATTFCDQVIWMHQGQVIASGPSAQTLTPETASKIYGDIFETGKMGMFRLRKGAASP
jgi:iron complex transport system ATP-binding protein